MRWIALVVLAACGGSKSPEPAAPAPSAAAAPAPPGSCGATTCTGEDICIEIQVGPGTPTVPYHTDTEYRCSPAAETARDFSCGPVANRRQHCVALIPAAPPGPPH